MERSLVLREARWRTACAGWGGHLPFGTPRTSSRWREVHAGPAGNSPRPVTPSTRGKPFYDGLIAYIISAPVMAMVWEGPSAVAAIRQTMGSAASHRSRAPARSAMTLPIEVGRSLTHAASDPVENGEKEVALWFKPDELVDWKRKWIAGCLRNSGKWIVVSGRIRPADESRRDVFC
ncbi:MAG: hypothetical protein MZV70_17755 [Desulfobacterales bacterium]|nr:hypothetical protein [Desulfobacterales bacterium]